jgi:glycosyltransferase involved in cell wall biosynthesis
MSHSKSSADAIAAQSSGHRILFVDSLLTGGGTDELCIALAQALRKIGHTVWLAGPADSIYSKSLVDFGVSLHPAPRQKKFPFVLSLARCIRQVKPHILHAHHGRDYWPSIFAVWLSGQHPKIVLSRHLAKSPGSWISRLTLLSQCDAMITVSDFVAQVLRQGAFEPDSAYPERRSRPPMHGNLKKIFVAHGGINTDQFCPSDASQLRGQWKLQPDEFAFAVVGAYDKPHGKGQRLFLAAAARVVPKLPHARFLLIGRGDLAQTLAQDIAQLGLSGKALLTPYCSNMPQALNAIDCLVHPAVGTEALGLVLCEALACGRPVIASLLDGIPEAMPDPACGTLVEPGSVDALEQAMLYWAKQPRWNFDLRMRVHQQTAAKFSFQAAARRIEQIYRTVLSA